MSHRETFQRLDELEASIKAGTEHNDARKRSPKTIYARRMDASGPLDMHMSLAPSPIAKFRERNSHSTLAAYER